MKQKKKKKDRAAHCEMYHLSAECRSLYISNHHRINAHMNHLCAAVIIVL